VEEVEIMPEKIEQNLARAFAEESRASARHAAFALKAEQEGHSQLARLFRAVANAESVHGRRFLLLMRGKIGTTGENLRAAFEHKTGAKNTLYPAMVEAARGAPKAVQKAFSQTMKTDGEHGEFFEEALPNLLGNDDTPYYVCQICGHIHNGTIPGNCPVCKAVPGRFRKIV
jgi:rubrerythrin